MQPVVPLLEQFRDHVRDEAAFALLVDDLRALQEVLREQGAPVAVGLGLHPPVGDAAPEPGIVVHVLWGEPDELNLPTHSAQGFAIHVEVLAAEPAGTEAALQSEAPAPQPPSAFRQAYTRPPGGVSIGLAGQPYSGTLGCYLKAGDRYFLLTARNVLDPTVSGRVGMLVQQPSHEDGNNTRMGIATSVHLTALDPTRGNPAHAGIALLTTDAFDPRILAGPDTYVSLVSPCAFVTVGEEVQKSGRTTGRTSSVVKGIGVQVSVMMPNGKAYAFIDCIAVTQTDASFLAGGDTGALLVNKAQQPVGLVLAANAQTAFATPISAVLDALHTVSGLEFEIVVG